MRNKKNCIEEYCGVGRTDRTFSECKLKTTDEIFCCAVENQNFVACINRKLLLQIF